MSLIYKFVAFVQRDFRQEMSYRLNVFMQIWAVFFSVAMFYFISKLFEGNPPPQLARYGSGYFDFAIVGISFLGFMTSGMSTFSASIRQGQMLGTLEAMLVTPTSLGTIVMASAVWTYLRQSLTVGIYLGIAALFGLDLSKANWLGVLLALGLSILAFSALGVLSAAFTLAFKRGNPISAFGGISALVGGAFFPIEVLPDWLQKLARFVPLTHALESVRGALLRGSSLVELGPSLLALGAFAALLLPAALLAFKLAVDRAKTDGSLAQY